MSGAENTTSRRVIAGRYQLGTRLGTGATSTVFEAVDTLLERKVAVKMLAPALITGDSSIDRFRDHARLLSGLNHPNLVAVSDWGTEQIKGVTVPFIVTEQLAGGTLREMIDRGRRLSASQALVVGLDACRGLDHLHRKGIVHGEITPGNLFFGSDRRLKISDIGFAQLLADSTGRSTSQMELALARYASPEQATDEPLDGKTDVYSLTLCLIESVTGDIPFAGDTTVATLANRVDRLMTVSADLGPLAAVFERGGRPKATERASAAEFGRALVQMAEKMPRPAPLPLVGLPTAMFESPAGAETTSELTRFKDPTGAITVPRPTAPAGPAISDPSGTIRRDSTAAVRRTLEPTAEPAKPRVISIGTDSTGAIEAKETRTQLPSLRRFNPMYLVIVAGVAAAAALGVIAYDRFANPEYSVPNLVGQNEGEARNAVAKNGWQVVPVRQNSDEVKVAGLVFKTDPPAGEKLEEGATLQLFVSLGPTLPKLPNLTDVNATDAATQLATLGLRLGTQTTVFSETVERGKIVSWSVPKQPSLKAGEGVVQGTEVAIVISKGPEPRKVPDINGLTEDALLAKLKELGLVAVAGEVTFSNDAPAGEIAVTEPPPGEAIERGGTVKYQVSKGPDLVTVPSLAGTPADVQKALEAAGFKVDIFPGSLETGTFVGVVIDNKQIKQGDRYPRGSEAFLVYLARSANLDPTGSTPPST